MTDTPMFPLGTVLFPGAVLPLRVFEPRYRALTERAIATDRRFGVVLITRGSEVGGGDERTHIGTMAEIVQAHEGSPGRWALVAVGIHRIRVQRWLDDDPYPRAEVEELAAPSMPASDRDQVAAVEAKLRRVLALRSELGERVPPLELDLDRGLASAVDQACALSPYGPADKQDLLEAGGPVARLALLEALIDDDLPFLQHRLAQG